jgi:hypothetical protein
MACDARFRQRALWRNDYKDLMTHGLTRVPAQYHFAIGGRAAQANDAK